MFRQYLSNYNPRTQLSIFLFLWASFFLITNLIQVMVFHQMSSGEEGSNLLYLVENHPGTVKWLNALNSILLFFVPAFLFAYLMQPKPLNYLKLDRKSKPKTLAFTVVIGMVLIPALVGLGGFIKEMELFGDVGVSLQEQRDSTMQLYFNDSSIPILLLNLILLALLPAVSEEFLFRGVLQRLISENLKSPVWSILIPSLAFALMHFSVYEFIPIFLAGVLLALIYYYSQSLILSIIVHFINNGMQVVMMSVANGEEAEFSPTVFGLVFLISALVLVVIFQQWKRTLPLKVEV